MTNDFGKIFSVFLLVFLLASAAFVPEDVSGATIDLGVGNPLILPTSPLYFFKELGRDLKRLFTLNREARIELELEILNAKAAEIESLEQRSNTEGMKKAIQSYGRSAEIIAGKIESLRQGEAESLVADFAAKAIAHQELFGRVLRHNNGLSQEVAGAISFFDKAGAVLIEKIGETESFNRLFEEAVANYKDDSLKEFYAVYILDRLQEKLPEEGRGKIAALKNDLILRFEGRFQAEANEDFMKALDELSLSGPEELKVLDEIREKVTNADLRSKLNIVRQRAFLTSGGRPVGSEAATEAIRNAETALLLLQKSVEEKEARITKSVRELLDRADFRLEQAKKFFRDGEYVFSFGQATAALAEAESGLNELGGNDGDLAAENLNLRLDFDKLKTEAKASGFTPESAPAIYELFNKAEKQLLEADTLEKLRSAKLLLVEIETKLKAR